MAREYKLPYTAFEIGDKLKTVDETKAALENNYYTKDETNTSFEVVNESIGEVITSLENKADLVDGKIPVEQLPDGIGSGGSEGLTEVDWEDVKNRPFYATIDNVMILENQTVTTVDLSEELELPVYGTLFELNNQPTSIKEWYNTIHFSYDGVEYDLTKRFFEEAEVTGFGNIGLTGFGEDTGEPFFMFIATDSDNDTIVAYYLFTNDNQETTHNISISSVSEIIKTLDIKYLPKNMALGYETKAFEDIIWDGNTDGLLSVRKDVDMGEDGMFAIICYKVSDAILSKELVNGAEMTYTHQDGEDTAEIDANYLFDVNENGTYIDVDNVSFFCVTEANTSADLSEMVPDLTVDFPESGVWFVAQEAGGMEMQCTKSLKAPKQIKKIDGKFIQTGQPNGVAGLDEYGMILSEQIRKDAMPLQYSQNLITSGAVYDAVNNIQITVDNSVTSWSNNPVSSSAVYTAINNNKINVDTSVQSGSSNAVSGGAVYNILNNYYTKSEVNSAIENKKVIVDTSVQNNSNNAVSGGAVYTALSNKQDKISVTSSDNGKFMRVVNGAWAAVEVPNAEEGEF